MSDGARPLLEVENLTKYYPISGGMLEGVVNECRAVDGISLQVEAGETFGIVGESGCGKSTAATSMLRIEEPTSGAVRFRGEDITEYDAEQLRAFRREAQMIFQDPDSSFDPRMDVGTAVAEPLIVQGMEDEQQRRAIVGDLLERVGLSRSDMERYPHEFSGGQKQRLGLARALTVNPSLIVADEPVSALDVSVQSEILRLLDGFQEELGLAVVIISHDLGVIRQVCDRVGVMYLGEFVEVGPTEELFEDPQHPYTRALLSAIPTPDPTDTGFGAELTGDVPDPTAPPSGCRFHTRCPEVIPPDDVSLPQEVWRHLLQFRRRVQQDAVDLESIIDAGVAEARDKYADVTEPTRNAIDDADLRRWVREEFELPDTLSDERAETAVADVLDELAATGEPGPAAEEFVETFNTVCERQKPELQQVTQGHEAACHLGRDGRAATNLPEDVEQPADD